MPWDHRRRINTEKVNVVAVVWGTEFIQFLAAQVILHWDNFEEYDKFIIFFKSSLCNSSYPSNRSCACACATASATRNCVNDVPQTEATTFSFSSEFLLLLCLVLMMMGWGLRLVVVHSCFFKGIVSRVLKGCK